MSVTESGCTKNLKPCLKTFPALHHPTVDKPQNLLTVIYQKSWVKTVSLFICGQLELIVSVLT